MKNLNSKSNYLSEIDEIPDHVLLQIAEFANAGVLHIDYTLKLVHVPFLWSSPKKWSYGLLSWSWIETFPISLKLFWILFDDFEQIDAYDPAGKKFYGATVLDVKPEDDPSKGKWKVLVSYAGWDSKWNRWIPVNKNWVLRFGTRTAPLRMFKALIWRCWQKILSSNSSWNHTIRWNLNWWNIRHLNSFWRAWIKTRSMDKTWNAFHSGFAFWILQLVRNSKFLTFGIRRRWSISFLPTVHLQRQLMNHNCVELYYEISKLEQNVLGIEFLGGYSTCCTSFTNKMDCYVGS